MIEILEKINSEQQMLLVAAVVLATLIKMFKKFLKNVDMKLGVNWECHFSFPKKPKK
ncbi:MAG: hypothetical protein Q8N30_17110 [Methylococcales bacterium]|nr:hypothetical protein [Methylococcales bacterium]